jgi:hypothetical protein
MKPPQCSLNELLLAIAFIGVFAAVAAGTSGEIMFVPVLVTVAVILFTTYLLFVLMFRKRCSRSGGVHNE